MSSSSNSRESVNGVSSRSHSTTQSQSNINYCLNVVNFLIASLGLRNMPVINSLDDLKIEILVKIHCTLLEMNFSQEFIPSSDPVEDARKIILSLKDKFGAEKFEALDATRIAEKHPLDLKFLLENYHLIHAYTKAKKERSSSNGLPVSRLSVNDISNSQHTFASTDDESQPTEPSALADSTGSQTIIENRVNIKDLNQSRNTTKENEKNQEIYTYTAPARKKKQGPTMTSSPHSQAKIRQTSREIASNVSSINSMTDEIQRTFATRKSVEVKNPDNVLHSQQGKNVTDAEAGRQDSQIKILYSKDSDEFMDHLAESIKAMDSDVKYLKPKPSKPVKETKTDYDFKSVPNIRDILPVDLRFPYYGGGTIIPKCKPINRNKRPVSKNNLKSKLSMKQSETSCDSSESDISTRANRASLIEDTISSEIQKNGNKIAYSSKIT